MMSDSTPLGHVVGENGARVVIITDSALPFCSSIELLSKQQGRPSISNLNISSSSGADNLVTDKSAVASPKSDRQQQRECLGFDKESVATCYEILRQLGHEIIWLSLRNPQTQDQWSSYDCQCIGDRVCMVSVEHKDLLSEWWIRFLQPNLVIIQDITSEQLCYQLKLACLHHQIPYAVSILNDITSCEWLTESVRFLTRQVEILTDQGRPVTVANIVAANSNAQPAIFSFTSNYIHDASAVFVESDVLAKQLFQIGRLSYCPQEIQVIQPCGDIIRKYSTDSQQPPPPPQETKSALSHLFSERDLILPSLEPTRTIPPTAAETMIASLRQCLNKALIQARKTYRVAILTTWCDDSVGLMGRALVRTLISSGYNICIFAYRPSWIQRKNYGDSRDGQRDHSEWVSANTVHYSRNPIHHVDMTELAQVLQSNNVGVCLALEHLPVTVIQQLHSKMNIRVYALPAATAVNTNNTETSSSLWDYHAYNGVICQYDHIEQAFRKHGFQSYQLSNIGFAPTPLLDSTSKKPTDKPLATETVRLLLVGGLNGWLRKHIHINLHQFVDAYAYIIQRIKEQPQRKRTSESFDRIAGIAFTNALAKFEDKSDGHVVWRNVQLTVTVQTKLDPEEMSTIEYFRKRLVELKQSYKQKQEEEGVEIPTWDIVIRNDHLSNHQVRQLYQTHHLVLELPDNDNKITTTTTPLPSFGLGTYEALAAGCPVVVNHRHPFVKNSLIHHLRNGIVINPEKEYTISQHEDDDDNIDTDVVTDSYGFAVRQFYIDLASGRLDVDTLCASTLPYFHERFRHETYAQKLLTAMRM